MEENANDQVMKAPSSPEYATPDPPQGSNQALSPPQGSNQAQEQALSPPQGSNQAPSGLEAKQNDSEMNQNNTISSQLSLQDSSHQVSSSNEPIIKQRTEEENKMSMTLTKDKADKDKKIEEYEFILKGSAHIEGAIEHAYDAKLSANDCKWEVDKVTQVEPRVKLLSGLKSFPTVIIARARDNSETHLFKILRGCMCIYIVYIFYIL